MSLRSKFCTGLFKMVNKVSKSLGCEPVVELSQHSVSITMEHPSKTERAWDTSLYKRGQVYAAGYANPIKPVVRENESLDNPDEVDVQLSNEEVVEDRHVGVISSARYKMYMMQHLIEQLITPQKHWKLITFALIAMAILMGMNLVMTAAAAGLI